MSNLTRWNPLMSLFNDNDDLLPDFWSNAMDGSNSFMPAIDMYEDDDNIIVECQLAGIDPEKIKLSVENDNLCIKGEGEQKNEVEDKNYYRKEIRRGSFYRSIPLPASVEEGGAKAKINGGVLKISIPKKQKSKTKTIKIEK